MGTSELNYGVPPSGPEPLGLLKATATVGLKTLPNLEPFQRLDFQGNLGILITPLSDI